MGKINILQYNFVLLKSHIFGENKLIGCKDGVYNVLDCKISDVDKVFPNIENILTKRSSSYCIYVNIDGDTYILNALNISVVGLFDKGLKIVFNDYSTITLYCSRDYGSKLLNRISLESLISKSEYNNKLYLNIKYYNGVSKMVKIQDFKSIYIGDKYSLLFYNSKKFLGEMVSDIEVIADDSVLSTNDLSSLSSISLTGKGKILFNNRKYSLGMSYDGFYLLSQDDVISLGRGINLNVESMLSDIKYISCNDLNKLSIREVCYE